MNINATLVGQMISFAVFVGFTMKYVWPPITKALNQRQKNIADGLEAAQRGIRELADSQRKAAADLHESKVQANAIIEQAHRRASQILEENKVKAREEGANMLLLAQAEINQQVNQAKVELRNHVAEIAMQGAAKLLERNLDQAAQQEVLNKFIAEI